MLISGAGNKVVYKCTTAKTFFHLNSFVAFFDSVADGWK